MLTRPKLIWAILKIEDKQLGTRLIKKQWMSHCEEMADTSESGQLKRGQAKSAAMNLSGGRSELVIIKFWKIKWCLSKIGFNKERTFEQDHKCSLVSKVHKSK